MAKPILAYWKLRGAAEPIRYLLRYKNIDFEDKRYPLDSPGFQEWKKDKYTIGLEFPNLPYYIDGDIKMTQSIAILRYLGQKHGLDGKTDEQRRRLLVAEQQIIDYRYNFKSFLTRSKFKTDKEEYFKKLQPKLQEWQKFLGNREFMVGNIAYVDFLIYDMLDVYRIYHETILDDYPHLKTYFSRVKNLPELQKYFNSPDFVPLPSFTPTA